MERRNRRYRNERLLWGFVCALLLLASPIPAQNLLVNPGGETGDTTGWTDPNNHWGATENRRSDDPEGINTLWPANGPVPNTSMFQDVDVSAQSHAIDAGTAYAHLEGWMANYDQYPHDQATLSLEALNTLSQQLAYVSQHHRSPAWARYTMDMPIPRGTRTLRVHLIATRYVGSNNDAYFDGLSLEFNTNAPPITVSVASSNETDRIPVGGTLQLTATTHGATDSGYTWQSSFEAVATVSSAGVVTARRAGQFTVTAEGIDSHAIGVISLTAHDANGAVFTVPTHATVWPPDTEQTVTWDVIGTLGSGSLYFSSNGGATWISLASIPDVTVGEYAWRTPTTEEPLNQCRLKLQWSGGAAESPIFSVTPAEHTPIVLAGALYWGISFTGEVGHVYSVDYTDDLTASNWITVGTVTPTGAPCTWIDFESPRRQRGFYRVTSP